MRRPSATTTVFGGENRVALSSSSATSRTTSLTARAVIAMSVSTEPNSMRLYSSTSDCAARRASTSRASSRRGAQSEVELRSEEHTSELQSRRDLVCRLLLEKKKQQLRYQAL